MYCPNCGVQLEKDMLHCPLCGEAVSADGSARQVKHSNGGQDFQTYLRPKKMTRPEKKLTWEIVSIIILSGAIAAFVVDFLINRQITWSEYPVAICFTIFAYVSLFAFWNQRTIIEIIGGFLISSVFFIVLDWFSGGVSWSLALGIPLLFSANLMVTIYIALLRKAKYKGINLIAYAFAGIAILCILIDGIITRYETGSLTMQWSVIVAACISPVVIFLWFFHFRLKKGKNIKRTFHV